MLIPDINDPIWQLVARFAINVFAILTLMFGMYYRRYHDKELTTTASMFNIFAFAVLTVLSNVDFSIAAGFGLFAILALFNLRSEAIDKIEISYFFAAIAIAVICSVLGTSLTFVMLIVTFVLFGAWVLDHPRLLPASDRAKVTLDHIDLHILSDYEKVRAALEERLGVIVMHYHITEINYVTDHAQLRVYYRSQKGGRG